MKLDKSNENLHFVVFDIETVPDDLSPDMMELARDKFLRKNPGKSFELTAGMSQSCLVKEEDFVTYLSIHPAFNRIVCISAMLVKIDDPSIYSSFRVCKEQTFCGEDEKGIVKDFLNFISRWDNECVYVSFHGIGFDVPVILAKAIKYGFDVGVNVPRFCVTNKYQFDNPNQNLQNPGWGSKWDAPQSHLDLCKVMNYDFSLDLLCRFLGVPSSKTNCDGSQVHELFKSGKFKEIGEYCAGDVLSTVGCLHKVLLRYK